MQYSEWHKIDLHIHTDWSKVTKSNDYQGDFTVNELHERLTSNEVEIFSLTDHNIINLPAYEEYYNQFNSESDPLLLLGVELDIIINIDGIDNTYHSLIIFNHHDVSNAHRIGTELERLYTEKGITEKNDRVLSVEDIVNTFYDEDFFFIPHANMSNRSIVQSYSGQIEDAHRMILLMPSALEKVKEEVIHIYNRGFNNLLNDTFKDKEDIAYINFSDNHDIESYPCKHKSSSNLGNHEFYYIKGGKNYETIRLAFIDPKSRIKSTSQYIAINTLSTRIESVKIQDEGILGDSEIQFSPHLNVIIGGRSSGKSLLMNLLGRKLDKVSIQNQYKINDEIVLIKTSQDIGFKTSTSISEEVIYINQGDIVKYFEHQKLIDLAKDLNKSQDYQEALYSFSDQKDRLEEQVEALVRAYKEAFDLSEERKYVLHLKTLNNILSDKFILNFKYPELKDSVDQSVEIQAANVLLSQLIEDIDEFRKLNILGISDEEHQMIENFEKLIRVKNQMISEMNLNNNKRLDFLQSVNEIIESVNEKLSSESQQKNMSIKNRDELIQNINDRFGLLRELKIESERVESFDYSFTKKIKLNESVDLALEVEKEDDLKKVILEGINDIDIEKSLYINLLSLLNNKITIKNLGGNTPEDFQKKINTVLKEIKEHLDAPKDFLMYEDGTNSKNNSPGYNSEKYLEIILRNNRNDLFFIDQPEDNLGNRFIADTLVEIIRKIKFQKQIFLVTHNPSIVVYGDAECVIVALNTKNKISYHQLVIENQEAQMEICRILDGGEYIFNDRARKYNIKRILKEN